MSSTEAAAPKASGLKPPTKISRPCSVTPKPSLPTAATPRSANASIVLTEDTDSFIIGDKVWVGGTKPGQIAYIGETQFAPGEWAGVVLDEPIGKNDGSVAGIRYFQCEPKRGVFSRLTRLTREPLKQVNAASVSGELSPSSKVSDSHSSSRHSLLSPAGSVKDLVLKKASPSMTYASPGNTSVSQPASDLKIGDRVIVMSSMGSKAGVLRYMGTTDFAAGEWCGVELDDPVGKNDGSVGDRRYFECQPKCGLFAPVHKVSRSPASRRPSSCLVHRSGTPASGIRRAGSRESVVSVNSSVASSVRSARVRLGVTSLRSLSQRPGVQTPSTTVRTTMKDALREKDLQIEKLLNDRDLERAEITRAASQAEEAEHKLASLKEEHQKYQEETLIKLKELENLLTQVRAEKAEFLSQLEDEKRKVEDLQFQFEEMKINKCDIERGHKELELVNTAHEETIRLLERRLADEHHKCEILEQDSNKLFEAEESLTRYKEEVESLNKELDGLKKLSEEQVEQKSIETLKEKEKLENLSMTWQKKFEESEESSRKLEKDFELKFDVQLKDFESMKQAIEESHKQESEIYENKFKEKCEELNKAVSALKARESDINDLMLQIEKSQTEIQDIMTKLETAENASAQSENALRKDLEEKEKLLQLKDEDLKHAAENYSQEIVERNLINVKLEENVRDRDMEILKLKNELVTLRESDQASSDELKLAHVKEVEEKVSEISNLKASIDKKDSEIQQLSEMTAKLDFELKSKIDHIKNLEDNVTGLTDKLNTSELSVTALTTRIQSLELECGDSQRKLQATVEKCEQLSLQKEKLENDISELMSTSSDSSVQLTKLNSELREKDKELNMTKELVIAANQENESSKQKLQQAYQQNMKSEEELRSKLNDHIENLQRLEVELKNERTAKFELEQELEKARDLQKKMEKEARDNLEQVELKAQKSQDELSIKLQVVLEEKKELYESLGKVEHELDIKVQELSHLNETTNQKLRTVEDDLVKKCTELKCYEEKLEKISRQGSETEGSFRQEIETLKQKLGQSEEHISQKDRELASAFNKQTELQEERDSFEKSLSDMRKQITELSEEILLLNKENMDIKNMLSEAEKLKEILKEQNTSLESKIDSLTNELQLKTTELTSMEEIINSLKQEKINLENEFLLSKEEVIKLRKELELEKETSEKTQMTSTDKDKELMKLSVDITRILGEKEIAENLVHNLTAQVAKLTEEKLSAETHLSESNHKINSLMGDVSQLQENFEAHRSELQTKLEETQKEANAVHDMQKSLELEKLRIDGLQEKLSKTEHERDELLERCKNLELRTQDADQLSSAMELLQKEVQNLHERTEKQSQEILDQTKKELALKSEINQKQKQYENQMAEVQLYKCKQKEYESTIEVLEKEVLAGRLKEKQLNNASSPRAKEGQSEVPEESFQHSERDFLNSVIVDQQKKIDELNAHLELLNRGITPVDAKDLLLEGIVDRVVVPRLYCDICDMFDAHETEDCPRQATESPPPHPKHKPGTRPQIAERPYCEICEVFGHSTADCDDAETF